MHNAIGFSSWNCDTLNVPEGVALGFASPLFIYSHVKGLDPLPKENGRSRPLSLDQLAQSHGVANSVKIDVKGLSDRVIFGMSFTPTLLSLAINRMVPHVTWRYFETPVLRADYEFNFLDGFEARFVSPKWIGRDQLKARVEASIGSYRGCDVIARLKTPTS